MDEREIMEKFAGILRFVDGGLCERSIAEANECFPRWKFTILDEWAEDWYRRVVVVPA